MPLTTDTATHVYIKQDNPKGLMPRFTGPHPIVDRPSQSTIKVKMGTFRSGVENVQLHHWSNAKPAQVREDQPEAQMPVRGRPKKLAPGTDSSNSSASPPPVASPNTTVTPDDQTSTDSSGHSNKAAKINKLPERRSARIAARDHATSIGAIQLVHTGPPASPFSAGNSNHPKLRAWSATQNEIDILNLQINKRSAGV